MKFHEVLSKYTYLVEHNGGEFRISAYAIYQMQAPVDHFKLSTDVIRFWFQLIKMYFNRKFQEFFITLF